LDKDFLHYRWSQAASPQASVEAAEVVVAEVAEVEVVVAPEVRVLLVRQENPRQANRVVLFAVQARELAPASA
jgi:hypothetical protein